MAPLMLRLLSMVGMAAAQAIKGRGPAPSGGVPVTWFNVEPHRVPAFRRREPDAVDPLGLARALDANGNGDLAAEIRERFAYYEDAYPGQVIFIKVGH